VKVKEVFEASMLELVDKIDLKSVEQ
jgi:hypothetical protein